MSQRTRKTVHLIYGIYISVLILISAALLILACYQIYSEGNGFTRELVITQFKNICLPIYICLVSVVVGIIIHIAIPLERNGNGKQKTNYSMLYEKMRYKADVNKCDAELANKIKTERKIRFISVCVCSVLCIAASVPALILILNTDNYDTYKINESIIPAAVTAIIWGVITFILCSVLVIITNASLKREIALIKQAMVLRVPTVENSKMSYEKSKKKDILMWSIKGGIVLVAIALIAVGILNGGLADGLGKAIRICTECIGLG